MVGHALSSTPRLGSLTPVPGARDPSCALVQAMAGSANASGSHLAWDQGPQGQDTGAVEAAWPRVKDAKGSGLG